MYIHLSTFVFLFVKLISHCNQSFLYYTVKLTVSKTQSKIRFNSMRMTHCILPNALLPKRFFLKLKTVSMIILCLLYKLSPVCCVYVNILS